MDKENIEAPPHYLSLPHRFHDLENQLKSSLARQTKYVKALNYDETNETTGGWLILQFISSPYTWSFYFLTRLCFSHFFVFVVVMGVMIRFREKVLGALKKIAHAKNLLLHKVFSMPYQETKKVDYVKAARTLEQLRFLKKLLQDIQPLVLPRSEIVGKLDLTSHTDFASHIKIDSLPMPTPKKSELVRTTYRVEWARLNFQLINGSRLSLSVNDSLVDSVDNAADEEQRVMTANMYFDDSMPYDHTGFDTSPQDLSIGEYSTWISSDNSLFVQYGESDFTGEGTGAHDAEQFFQAFKDAYLALKPLSQSQIRLFSDDNTEINATPDNAVLVSDLKLEQTSPPAPKDPKTAFDLSPEPSKKGTSKDVEQAPSALIKASALVESQSIVMQGKLPTLTRDALMQNNAKYSQHSPPVIERKLSPSPAKSALQKAVKSTDLKSNEAISKPISTNQLKPGLHEAIMESLTIWLKKSLLSAKVINQSQSQLTVRLRGQEVKLFIFVDQPTLWRAQIAVPRLDVLSAEELLQANSGLGEIAFGRNKAGQTFLNRVFDPTQSPREIDASLKMLVELAQHSRFSVPREQVRQDYTMSKEQLTELLKGHQLPFEPAEYGVWIQAPTLPVTHVSQVVNAQYQSGLLLIQYVQALTDSNLETALNWSQVHFNGLAPGIFNVKGTQSLVLCAFLLKHDELGETLTVTLERMSNLGLTFKNPKTAIV